MNEQQSGVVYTKDLGNFIFCSQWSHQKKTLRKHPGPFPVSPDELPGMVVDKRVSYQRPEPDFPCGAVVQNPPANAVDTGSSLGL